jgi:thymidylate synthase
MMVDGTTEVNSNYGYFWNKNYQLSRVIQELKTNKETRRAIVVHYDINELDRYKHDTPCNDVLNFYIKDDKLHLTVFARSIDLVFGFCNDQYTFAKLMEMVAFQLDIPVGEMHWMVTNLHIYPRHYDMLK